jgi:carboxyl-terminal processing protease
MSFNEDNPSTNQAGRRKPGFLLLLAVLFGLGMAIVGFLIGRAISPAQSTAELVVSLPTAAEPAATVPAPAQVVTEGEAQIGPTLEISTPFVEPSATIVPASATPLPTDQPTDTPEPTAEIVIPPDGSPLETADFTTLYEVWDLIADQYDGPVPLSDEIVESIIAGSLETLGDDYTRYLPPDVAERMRQDVDGEVEGIGAFVEENEEGLFEVVRPIDGQPADLAGVMAGDVLIEVDGQSVLDVSFDEVILMVRGPEGTSVNLKFLREGQEEPLEFTIVRTRFEVPVVEFEILPSEIAGDATIGYIHLTEFTGNAETRLLEALDQVLAQGATGLIFDLRDNPGGFLDQSVAVADAFLPEGVALFERNIRGLDETFRTDDGDAAEAIPLVVLVNAGSASASEIVAGAIQDRGRAILVGETTFGKGSVQQIHPLSDGSELRVTAARWYTPNNNTIDGEGITPDIEVASPEDLGGVEDGQLMRAVEYLLTGQ